MTGRGRCSILVGLALAGGASAQPAPGPAPAPDATTPDAPASDAPAPDAPPAPAPDEDLARARTLFESGRFTEAREVLLRAHELRPRAALLFALGQVELNLGRPREAIAYYEQFIATGPSEDELALAQQAIGAAQMQLSIGPAPRPEAPAPRRRPPRWDTGGTWIVILGGAAIGAGAGMFVHGGRLADDRSGTLSEYDARVDRARTWRWIGAGAAAAGVAAIGVAIVRWRLSGGLEIVAAPRPGGAAVSLGRAW